ncbi:MAG: hypothetical protein V1706_08960 [Pseudomonadota bacterium]
MLAGGNIERATAGGMEVDREVTLDSLELQGWVVHDVSDVALMATGWEDLVCWGVIFLTVSRCGLIQARECLY